MTPNPDDWVDGDSPFRSPDRPVVATHNHPKPRAGWLHFVPNCPRCLDIQAKHRQFNSRTQGFMKPL